MLLAPKMVDNVVVMASFFIKDTGNQIIPQKLSNTSTKRRKQKRPGVSDQSARMDQSVSSEKLHI